MMRVTCALPAQNTPNGYYNVERDPRAKLIAKIANSDNIDFSKDGTYNAGIEGEMTIKDVTKPSLNRILES